MIENGSNQPPTLGDEILLLVGLSVCLTFIGLVVHFST